MAHGYVGVYPEQGSYQFYADEIRPQCGQALRPVRGAEGGLAGEVSLTPSASGPSRSTPRRLGVVTSAGAAALLDVLRVLFPQRWPWWR